MSRRYEILMRIKSLEEFKGYLLLKGFVLSEQFKEGYIFYTIKGDIIIFVLKNDYCKDTFSLSVSFIDVGSKISPNVSKLFEKLPSFSYDPSNCSFNFCIDNSYYFEAKGDLIFKDKCKVFLSKEELFKGLAKLHASLSPFISFKFNNTRVIISSYNELSKYSKYFSMIYKVDISKASDNWTTLDFYINCDLIM